MQQNNPMKDLLDFLSNHEEGAVVDKVQKAIQDNLKLYHAYEANPSHETLYDFLFSIGGGIVQLIKKAIQRAKEKAKQQASVVVDEKTKDVLSLMSTMTDQELKQFAQNKGYVGGGQE